MAKKLKCWPVYCVTDDFLLLIYTYINALEVDSVSNYYINEIICGMVCVCVLAGLKEPSSYYNIIIEVKSI